MEPGGVARVLLVDDQPKNLLALEAVLGGMGLDLVRAHSGEEALRHVLDGDFAVILMDVQMPGMDGFETAELIRKRTRTRYRSSSFGIVANSPSDACRSSAVKPSGSRREAHIRERNASRSALLDFAL